MKCTRKQQQKPPEQGTANGPQPTEEQTQPLPNIASLVFEGFSQRHQLSMLDVALAAGVRLLMVWQIAHDEPVSEEHAQQVYAGLRWLAGVPYHGRIRRSAE